MAANSSNPSLGASWSQFVLTNPDAAASHWAQVVNRSRKVRTSADFKPGHDMKSFLLANPPMSESEEENEPRPGPKPPVFGRTLELHVNQLVIPMYPLQAKPCKNSLNGDDSIHCEKKGPGSPRIGNFCYVHASKSTFDGPVTMSQLSQQPFKFAGFGPLRVWSNSRHHRHQVY